MEELTGLDSFDWLLISLFAFGVVLIVGARRKEPPGTRAFGFLVVPVVAGIAVLAFLLAFYSEVLDLFPRLVDRVWALAFAAVVVVVAVALTDWVLLRLAGGAGRLLSRSRLSERSSHDASMSVFLFVPLVAVAVGLPRVEDLVRDPAPAVQTGFRVEARYRLPGTPMDVVFRGEGEGYVSLAEGRIVHFRLPSVPGGDLAVETVFDGLDYPRGLAIVDDSLFVADLGPLPVSCEPNPSSCLGKEAETTILEESRGRIVAFDIREDGGLEELGPILSDLPVTNWFHAVNALAAGPDGRLYASIGSLDALWGTPEIVSELTRPQADLLGTVVSVNPDGSELQVFAEGIRNIYDFTFDDQGRLYGVDNDGPTVGGWRGEAVLPIREGAHYGYPREGTFGPHTLTTDSPIWLMPNTIGSAGIEWATGAGLDPGLLIGSCGSLHYLRLREYPDGFFVASRNDLAVARRIPGCVTAVEVGPPERVVLAVVPYPPGVNPQAEAGGVDATNSLYVVRPESP